MAEDSRKFTIPWVEKNLGFTRKTLYNYRKAGFIELIKDESLSNDGRESYLISEDELLKVWLIKLLVSWQYSHKDIKDLIDNVNENPDYSFLQDSLGNKIKELEEKKRETEILLGAAKYAKMTGYLPLPERIEPISFFDYLSDVQNQLTIHNREALEWEYNKLQELEEPQNEGPIISSFDLDALNDFESVFGQELDISEILEMCILIQKLAMMSDRKESDSSVQNLVAKLHIFYAEKLFPEYDKLKSAKYFAEKLLLEYSGDSDVAKRNRIYFGKQGSAFIASALEYYADHNE